METNNQFKYYYPSLLILGASKLHLDPSGITCLHLQNLHSNSLSVATSDIQASTKSHFIHWAHMARGKRCPFYKSSNTPPLCSLYRSTPTDQTHPRVVLFFSPSHSLPKRLPYKKAPVNGNWTFTCHDKHWPMALLYGTHLTFQIKTGNIAEKLLPVTMVTL